MKSAAYWLSRIGDLLLPNRPVARTAREVHRERNNLDLAVAGVISEMREKANGELRVH